MVELPRGSAGPDATAMAPTADAIVRDGAWAGVLSVVVFTWVHHLTISDIWSMLPMMLVAGAACGACITWSFQGLFRRHSLGSWASWNLVILAALGALAVASMVVFDPVTTMAAVMDRGGPVDDLIVRALPLSASFIVVTAAAFGLALGEKPSDFVRALITSSVLTLVVGLNVSVLGLVEFAGDSIRSVLEFFALIVLLDLVYAVAFVFLGRRWLMVGHGSRPE